MTSNYTRIPSILTFESLTLAGAGCVHTFSQSLDRRKDAHELRDGLSRMWKVFCVLQHRRLTDVRENGEGETTAPGRFDPIRKQWAWAVEFVTRIYKPEHSPPERGFPAPLTGTNGYRPSKCPFEPIFGRTLCLRYRYLIQLLTSL